MSEALVTESAASRSEGRPAKKTGKSGGPGFFGRIATFLRQVIGEMKKVVTPTRQELINMTAVVLVFVVIVMGIVTVLDFGFGKAVLWVFGGHVSTEQ
ncbi:preprotein translocase subunit SecE [Arthrobacter silviterrae]|jgi:preprotein translocase subunit SecE|uniref:Protein translocase subunit SecE n=1 Tax=Arthrobacter silviterrae TaxID=2026658 RepID=A0ABX0DIW4_9MICC|nr:MULTISPECIES: preprotein translocase subunit SecE [Arthrobacter]MCU6479252.1 preprotein translocase subunit SecE [Arthrobacter sp. A2-55]MDQ0277645.1 preprotein translocase subunit SecE [Arthrobacter silviterrae]NGN84243.1 preprotein translocase subunit SecE [Arthrobacter silviterrae]